jgi:indolepyruvate ferredoxin oxidoreductase, beta subunit
MSERPVTILIAALGGEGGGVLTDWIVDAAMRADLPVQATSIPGVAQRTGATTYYVEVFPRRNAELAGRRPLMALYPSPGGVDLMLASEVLEAGRALENGFVTPDRTTLAAATHRIYAVAEKQAMADGRFETGHILAAAKTLARRAILFDLTQSARTRDLSLNAVLLGIAAASGVLPIDESHFTESVKAAGIAVEANLAAFALGLELARDGVRQDLAPRDDRARRAPQADMSALIGTVRTDFPPLAQPVVEAGLARMLDYQDASYARLYYDRVRRIAALDRGDGALTAAVARHLALWMSYEDVIRVADLKTRAERFATVRAEVRAKPDEPVTITEFLKPGIEEVSAILPPRLGRALERWGEKNDRARRFHLPMRLKSTSLNGFLRLWLLARLTRWRPRTYRFAEESREIEAWLGAVAKAAPKAPLLAREIAELAGLRKGYGDTHRRGRGNYRRIFEEAQRALAEGDAAAPRLAQLRQAALADPDGAALARALAAPLEEAKAAE